MKRILATLILAFVMLSAFGCSTAEGVTTTQSDDITLSLTSSQYVNATPVETYIEVRDYWEIEGDELVHKSELRYFVVIRYTGRAGMIVESTLIIDEETYNELQGKTRIALKIE